MTPREFFPNMPDEVFEMWLEPIIQRIGWPFTTINDDLAGTPWRSLLGDISLSDWHQLIWSQVDLEFTKIPFSVATKLSFDAIIEHCVHGRHTGTANLQNTKERFRACAEFVRLHHTIPERVILLYRNKAIEVVDGYHRIAALIHVGAPDGYKLLAWIPHPARSASI